MIQENLFTHRSIETRWANFENPNGEKGSGGKENHGAKGHAFDCLKPHEIKQLLQSNEGGIIRRIWMTIDDRSPDALENLWISMYWDDAEIPSVLAPLGDFFCMGVGEMTTFENEFFSSPEGRSFNCIIPMPYRKNAKVFIENRTDRRINRLFYEIAFTIESPDEEALYFHADYSHPVCVASDFEDFEILPRIKGKGRFLGSTVSIVVDDNLKGDWWGEGEVKIYLDGDTTFPTLIGTGTEDYIGTAWGQDVFANRFQGCTYCKDGRSSFYRFHIPDPIYFNSECAVMLQQIGGNGHKKIVEYLADNIDIKVISADHCGDFTKLLEFPTPLETLHEDSYLCYYRKDDYRAVAYYYLNRP